MVTQMFSGEANGLEKHGTTLTACNISGTFLGRADTTPKNRLKIAHLLKMLVSSTCELKPGPHQRLKPA